MWADLRFAARTLRRSPIFTAAAVLSLALGIGANTAIFSLINQVLLRSLPVRDPERLLLFHSAGQGNGWSTGDNNETLFSNPMYRDLRDRSGAAFSGVIARARAPVAVSYAGQTEHASAEIVSGNFFDVLGVPVALGRTFTQEEDAARGANPVVVFSYGYWTRRFGSNREILGQSVNINGNPMVVVGIASPSFRSVLSGQNPDVFVPIAMKRQVTPTWDGLGDRGIYWLNVFARLKPGVSRQQAQVAMQPVYRAILEDDLKQKGGRQGSKRDQEQYLARKLDPVPAAQGINQLGAQWQTPLMALMAMVGLVLLIACANIANLLLVRAAGRQREIAIRLAIGATRRAIARQLLVESFVIAVAGGLAGLLVADWTTKGLLRLAPGGTSSGWLSAQIDARVLGFTLLLSLVTGLLFGIVPALQATRPELAPALKNAASGFAAGPGRTGIRRVLVAAQVALSLVLLVAAGLFARSLVNLMRVDPGFRVEQLLVFDVDPRLNGYSAVRGFAFYRDLQQRLSALPGVHGVGAANPGPFEGNERGGSISVEGYQFREGEQGGASMHAVSSDYFRAIGVAQLAGREFTERDDAGAPRVVIVNEAFVKRYLKGQNPLGRHVGFSGGRNAKLDREIVGVVRDHKHASLREDVRRTVYFPYSQDERLDRLHFYVRTERAENEIAPLVRQVVRQMDADLPVFGMRSMRVHVDDSMYRDRLLAILSTAFGLLATLLAALGLYGLIAYTVARRTAEIGIRMALGALPADAVRLVMRDVAWLTLIGIAVGLPAAVGLTRLIASQLYGLQPHDPLVLGGAAILIAIVSLLAGYVPGRRAARIDPMRALRYE